MYIFSYKTGSRGAKALSRALRAPLIRHTRSQFHGTRDKTLINWGATELPPHVRGCRILNPPDVIHKASNKAVFFATVQKHCRVVPWTTSRKTAEGWLSDGRAVVVRSILAGHSGAGMAIVEPGRGTVLPQAPLYTRYVPKMDEFRIHLVGGRVIDYQRKARRNDVPKEQANFKIRNLDGGFVFIRGGVNPPQDVLEQARRAFAATGLDFGAVDVIYNRKEGQAYILEVNTAPGLEGETVVSYSNALRKL